MLQAKGTWTLLEFKTLLMVEKSGFHQLSLLVYPHYLQFYTYIPGGVVWDFFHQRFDTPEELHGQPQ